ncbi:hypothetical protein PHAVU_005G014200 [Phaseolus vulgaris]|uniref:Uncharacterized protein n=2 Tax=Phaseolus vulgaris TaxID=3885 RepID=V7BUQ1_PHAVU|nr:hypothetical protein PHAVU_005G014200g [Phaseolus vulgaris]ESW20780.1 hypothetical protein PHAVU_005G014200g [Phaseolus vulgaris]
MADSAVSFVLELLYQLVREEGSLLKGLGNDFSDIKQELESIKAFLKDADRRAGDHEGVKTWVKQLRELSFSIEDVIDEYIMDVAHRVYHHQPCIASLQKIAHHIKTLKSRHQIASEIQDIKTEVQGIKERSAWYKFQSSFEDGSTSNSRGAKDFKWGDPRIAAHFIEETEVVGLELPRDELIGCLIKGTDQLSLVFVVGMGGLGKTTLAEQVFNNQQVKRHFHCGSFITVSQSYTVRKLLTEMIQKFCKDANEPIPKGLHEMDDKTLVTEVRQYLQSKRYLLLFDDVWKENFSDEILLALPNNNKGGRIIITTRMMQVAEYFKKSVLVHVHKLQPLSPNKAWELFCKKAFRFEPSEQCPTELEDMSKGIVEKCGGLPLAIVCLGGLLATKSKTMFEWRKVCENLRMELEHNTHLNSLKWILSLSYDDLPHNLRSCMLYFGLYPEDYSISRKRLTRQWMAEGLVKNEERKPEDVAEDYLTQLIGRSLVQVSRVGFDGKVKTCQIHDLLREVIIRKMNELSFCHLMHEDDELDSVGITRRFSIATCSNNVLRKTSNLGIRAIYVFTRSELPEDFVGRLSAKFKLLKVLDFERTLLNHVPNNLGNLFHLRYLNLSHTKVEVLPRSIGKLLNLETLDLRQTQVQVLPREIKNLTKLRLLPVYYRKYEGQYSMLNFTTGVKMEKGIGCLKSLQKLYFLEADHGGLDLMQELKMLKQLRKLGIRRVQTEYSNALSSAIGEMSHLESLNVSAKTKDEIIDLNFASTPPPYLQVLNLKARVTKLPDWIPKLKYLVKLRLGLSNLEGDPLDSLQDLPNLLRLNMWDDAYVGESLHFRGGGFPRLKEVDLTRLSRLSSLSIDEGALLGLEHFRFKDNPQMKVVPHGLKHLKNLQFLGFADMPPELVESIDPEKGGQDYSVIKHIPLVLIRQNVGPKFHDYELRPIPTLATV